MRDIFSKGVKVAGLVGLLCLTGCGEPNLEPTTNPYSQIRNIEWHHRGVKEWRDDRDFDGDGYKDTYVVMKDGAIYATNSSELVRQIANKTEKPTWRWYRVEP